MSKKLFLTGEPGVGKTTIFQKVVSELGDDCAGFYTREMREDNLRVGFELITVNMPIGNGPLAHVNFDKNYQISKYGVDITHLEKVIAVTKDLFDKNKILIIDEIGPMETFSEPFKDFIKEVLASDERVLATIKMTEDPWRDALKNNFNIPLVTATLENRDKLPQEILNYLRS